MTQQELIRLLDGMSAANRATVFQLLRNQYRFALHPLEHAWNTSAEAVLEAIAQAPDLTQRGIRGVLAEATFRTVVVPRRLGNWLSEPVPNDEPYDLLLHDSKGPIRVQVKLQRRLKGKPLLHRLQAGSYVVETQRTRSGTRRASSEPSRPYRIDEFDILAVCLQPSSQRWDDFIYCAVSHLATRLSDPRMLEVLQPVPMEDTSRWTRNFDEAVARFRARQSK